MCLSVEYLNIFTAESWPISPVVRQDKNMFFPKKMARTFSHFDGQKTKTMVRGVEKVYDAWKLFTFMATASICRDEICDLVESHSLQTVNLIYGTLGGPT